jgi:hypothetical protein
MFKMKLIMYKTLKISKNRTRERALHNSWSKNYNFLDTLRKNTRILIEVLGKHPKVVLRKKKPQNERVSSL